MPNRRSERMPGRGPTDLMPPGLNGLSWGLPRTFLGLDERASEYDHAGAVILPVPYEATTSYGGGAEAGPAAIIEASRYIELYDHELDSEPHTAGIYTLPPLELTRAGPGPAMTELEEAFGTILDAIGDRFLVMLGGEHSVSAPAIRSYSSRVDERISVLLMDAHTDMRAEHEGSEYSHACAMTRVLDVADVVGVGVRGVTREEADVARNRHGVTLIYADDMWEDDGWMELALDALGSTVYLTFDVDYFDPSLVPSTGAPEPGGGDWYRTLRFLRRVFSEKTVIGCDVVELAPTPGLHAPDFLVAKLVFKLIAYRFAKREGP